MTVGRPADLGRQAIGEGCGGTPPASERLSPSGVYFADDERIMALAPHGA